MASSSSSVSHQQKEGVGGELDAETILLLLTLVVEDDVLRTQTCYGEHVLLQQKRWHEQQQLLLQQARILADSATSPLCLEMLRRVVGRTKEPVTMRNPTKDKLFNEFLEETCVKKAKGMAYPTLMQVHIHIHTHMSCAILVLLACVYCF